jgi:hypothetical protein
MFTSPKLMLPFQIDRGMMGSSKRLMGQQDTCREPHRPRPRAAPAAAGAAGPVEPPLICEKLGAGGAPMSIGKHSKPDPGPVRPRRRSHRVDPVPRCSRPGRALLTVLCSLGLMACACALAGCGRGPQARGAGAPAASGRHAATTPKEVEIQENPVKTGIEAGDASLADKVRARLAGDPQLRLLRIEVDAEAGRVTLWGHVGRAEERTAAEQQARRTPGVTSVINLIKVGG